MIIIVNWRLFLSWAYFLMYFDLERSGSFSGGFDIEKDNLKIISRGDIFVFTLVIFLFGAEGLYRTTTVLLVGL